MSREEKIASVFKKFETDKYVHNYAPVYADIPEDIEAIFEIGIDQGHSLLAWAELFPKANIYGLDTEKKDYTLVGNHPRIKFLQSNIRDFDAGYLPFALDLIVDDGSHEVGDILAGWERLYNRLRGTYIIEDIQLDRFRPIWDRLISTFPKSQILFWRTTDWSGDCRCAGSDSHCFKIKL